MKKSIILLLSVVLIFAMLFISCDKPNGQTKQTNKSDVDISITSGKFEAEIIKAEDVASNTVISEWYSAVSSGEAYSDNYVLASLLPNSDFICYVYRPKFAKSGITPVLETAEDSITAVIKYEKASDTESDLYYLQFSTGVYGNISVDFRDSAGNPLTNVTKSTMEDISVSTWKK